MSTNHGLDTDTQVFFYEQDYYVLSNFSSFKVRWRHLDFDTSEHAYHYAKFMGWDHKPINSHAQQAAYAILAARSAHEAFKIAEINKIHRHSDWDSMKRDVMKDILIAKVSQHEYVRRKLLETGDRQLIENSHRDNIWGWGPNRDGQNLLGKLWMEIRAELRATS